ncbi:uncharacterized protein SPSC_01215 [Sporisorium scitamineum]|uniref:Tyr recombinase domain-containing protein n=1 Tax=Sporisorium scitamineum TaxID=49012 RepID=A0A127Z9C7_9BASI|nr:uncharacterized protein SPSC_01215 [Sporisorium scitamineum]
MPRIGDNEQTVLKVTVDSLATSRRAWQALASSPSLLSLRPCVAGLAHLKHTLSRALSFSAPTTTRRTEEASTACQMVESQLCYRCKRPWPPNHYIGVNGRQICTCASCRRKPPAPTPTPSLSPPRSLTAGAAQLPTPLGGSPSSPRRQTLTSYQPSSSAFASAASVTALEQRLGNLERQLDSRFSELLDTLQAPHTSHLAQPVQQALQPQPQALPFAQPAAASANPSAGQPAFGESPPLSVTCCFAWVPPDIVSLVKRDQLKPEHLVKLRDPESIRLQPKLSATLPKPALSSPKLAPSLPRLAPHDGAPLPPRAPSPADSAPEHSSAPSPHVFPAIRATPSAPPQAGLFTPQAGSSAPQAGFPTAQAGSSPSLDTFAPAGIVDMSSDRASHLLLNLLTGPPPSPRPNTLCEQPMFDATDMPATVGTLQLRHWSQFLDLYPDRAFAAQLQGALQHGVKLGYDGPLRLSARQDVPNLPMSADDVQHLRCEIEARLAEGRLRRVDDPDGLQLVCSPVGMVPKPHSDKKHTIYHLSHPRRPGSRLPSVNDGISTSFVTIHYKGLDAVMDFIRNHPSASLWKADLEDAFRHVIVAESDARLMGIHFDGHHYQECALVFGGRSSPFLFNLFAEFLHWLASFALHASDATVSPAVPIQVLSLAAAALGFKISSKKTVWDTTRLEILGIELDSVTQTASITREHRQRIINMCSCIVDCGCASLLELQQVAGHLQFVTRVAPHGCAFLRRLYDAVKAHYKVPFGRRLSRATRAELVWWIETLHSWDGVSLLQPSPLIIEHIWTDALPCTISAHLGSMDQPIAAFSKELSRHHCKNIRFLEALAVLEALRRFSPLWSGHRKVMLHMDNENVEYGLKKGSIRDPATQALFREIFALCLRQHIDLVPVRVSSEANVLAGALSRRRFAFLQQHYPVAFALLPFSGARTVSSPQQLSPPPSASAAQQRTSGMGSPTTLGPARQQSTTTTSLAQPEPRPPSPFPPPPPLSLNGVLTTTRSADHTASSSTTSPRSSRGTSTSDLTCQHLTPSVLPASPEASSVSPASPTPPPSCQSRYRSSDSSSRPYASSAPLSTTVGCTAQPFASPLPASFVQASSPTLTVGSVAFASDSSFATIHLPSSKTDPFRAGATLTAPAVPLSTCAVLALAVVCQGRSSSAPLLVLEGGQPFSRSAFTSVLRRCLQHCGIQPSAYSSHSFRRGAATWAAANGADDETIRVLGRWRSDCFRRYIDKSAVKRAATARTALYANTSHTLDLSVAAWHDL